MEFEFDPQKSESNKDKHGIDFVEAQELWRDEDAYEVESNFEGEKRYLVVGEIDGVRWTAVITRRDESARIISVRRSRGKESEYYDHLKGI